MDKENGKGHEGNSSSKLSNASDPTSLLDAASLFGAYWPRGDANSASAANLFAAAGGGFGLSPHPSMQFGMLPPPSSSSRGGGLPSYPTSTAAAAAYSNAYTNTLSVAASQAASLGIPAASAAWWSMASHLAAQDYLARLQATGLNFPLGGGASPADLQYAASLGLTLPTHTSTATSSHHNSAKAARRGSASTYTTSSSKARDRSNHYKDRIDAGLVIQSGLKSSSSGGGGGGGSCGSEKISKKVANDSGYLNLKASMDANCGGNNKKSVNKVTSTYSSAASSSAISSSSNPSIFTSPLSLACNFDNISKSVANTSCSVSTSDSLSGSPSNSILSDPNSILGGVRLPPDTEIIKYTSSIVGPKIPGTTNRGRKKTISLDPPMVSVHPSHSSTGMLIERHSKRAKLNDHHHDLEQSNVSNDRVEVIKLPATNGSPNFENNATPTSGGDTPLNLSLKPCTSSPTTSSNSLNSLSNMSASIGADRISRRKPGPKPRRVAPTPGSGLLLAGAPSASLSQLFASADSPRPPSRNEGSDGGSSTSSICATNSGCMTSSTSNTTSIATGANHKEGRPRNLGRGVSKPKKNTVASLLAQSRALGIKPMPILDPNATMNQQMNLLKSNILAAQQYISEAGGDEKALNKFLQEKFRGTLSDSSTIDASTDSDNLTDSNHTDSELELELSLANKKQKHYDERSLRIPLEKGWKRETIIRGLTKSGGIKGDVTYNAPDSANKFKQMSDITQYLEYQKNGDLSKDNFTFSCRVILGDYLQPVPPEMPPEAGEFLYMNEEEVTKRLEEIKSAMRTSLPVEQRIEMARKQQAARAAARLDREHARLAKEIERSERQEAARRDREARSQQLLEAKRKRQEELEKHKQEEQQRKQQEREYKRQQAAILKEQMYIQEISKQREMLYTVELERERRRQHMALVKALENRRKLEERERKKQQLLAEKQANKEKKLEQRKIELEILAELRKPCEDLELDQRTLPDFERIPGLKLAGKAFADILMMFEFLHNFGETLGFDMESLPTLDSLQQALMPNEHSSEAEEELFSVMTHLLVCAIEDPGIPNPARHTTILGQSLKQADITHANLSEILRIYLYANATGEVKALTGVHFERDREKRVADHHQTDNEMQATCGGKNSQYYELLHDNDTWKMSDMLKDKPFMALAPTVKAEILAFICNELLQNKAVIRQIESSLENVGQQRKEKWLLDTKIRKVRMIHGRKVRVEAMEKAQKVDGCAPGDENPTIDSPSLHKDDLLDDDENDMSENESVGTQPEEEEDNKLSGEELGKKLEKLVKSSEQQLAALNNSTLQLRATCFGSDRYWRRYWSLAKAGGVFVEAMESAEPEVLIEQNDSDQSNNAIKSINDINNLMNQVDSINDTSIDKEVSQIVGNGDESENGDKLTDDNENEHRKTPNRCYNGEMDKNERNLAELRKSVDDIVQNIKKQENESQLISSDSIDSIKIDLDSIGSKKFNLFEKLGQCMERENKSEEDLKADVKAEIKEELKNEILNELKCEIKTESKIDDDKSIASPESHENKWFSILSRDNSCEGVYLTAGNRWDNGGVGACTRDNLTELKIPVFPPPSVNSSISGANNTYHSLCDSPAPLQMTPEESVQLEHIKKHGMPKSCPKKSVPLEKRYGWWRIAESGQLKDVLDNLHVRGARERELKRNFISIMQTMYEKQSGEVCIDEGHKDLIDLPLDGIETIHFMDGGAPVPDEVGAWSQTIAHRVDMFLLEQVEALEDKVASASMQVKGWKLPNRECEEVSANEVVAVARERLSSLEANIERRYLKPPLGIKPSCLNISSGGSTGAPEGVAAPPVMPDVAISMPGSVSPIVGNCQGGMMGASAQQQAMQQETPCPNEVPKGLVVWREAVNRAQTSAQLAMCLYSLESSIAWDKSIMKANCQFCQSGDNEDKLLLCDGCDKGYHTYCFKPKMDNIPDGDWYCYECMNKATNERNCIVCGKKSSPNGTRLILCELCPRSYHTDCMFPPLNKVPRGKWYCSKCISKKPVKKPIRKNLTKPAGKDNDLSDHPPASPTPSHSSVTTNEDQPSANCNQSDVSNSSTANAGSPSTQSLKKERISKKLLRELAPCKAILEDLECHDDAWPFLLPVNTKQFPTYKKIIKAPMDLSTIKKKLNELGYKSREEFCLDVRQIFTNCEVFNEDDSPVGKAGHCMRQFFEARWNELIVASS